MNYKPKFLVNEFFVLLFCKCLYFFACTENPLIILQAFFYTCNADLILYVDKSFKLVIW